MANRQLIKLKQQFRAGQISKRDYSLQRLSLVKDRRGGRHRKDISKILGKTAKTKPEVTAIREGGKVYTGKVQPNLKAFVGVREVGKAEQQLKAIYRAKQQKQADQQAVIKRWNNYVDTYNKGKQFLATKLPIKKTITKIKEQSVPVSESKPYNPKYVKFIRKTQQHEKNYQDRVERWRKFLDPTKGDKIYEWSKPTGKEKFPERMTKAVLNVAYYVPPGLPFNPLAAGEIIDTLTLTGRKYIGYFGAMTQLSKKEFKELNKDAKAKWFNTITQPETLLLAALMVPDKIKQVNLKRVLKQPETKFVDSKVSYTDKKVVKQIDKRDIIQNLKENKGFIIKEKGNNWDATIGKLKGTDTIYKTINRKFGKDNWKINLEITDNNVVTKVFKNNKQYHTFTSKAANAMTNYEPISILENEIISMKQKGFTNEKIENIMTQKVKSTFPGLGTTDLNIIRDTIVDKYSVATKPFIEGTKRWTPTGMATLHETRDQPLIQYTDQPYTMKKDTLVIRDNPQPGVPLEIDYKIQPHIKTVSQEYPTTRITGGYTPVKTMDTLKYQAQKHIRTFQGMMKDKSATRYLQDTSKLIENVNNKYNIKLNVNPQLLLQPTQYQYPNIGLTVANLPTFVPMSKQQQESNNASISKNLKKISENFDKKLKINTKQVQETKNKLAQSIVSDLVTLNKTNHMNLQKEAKISVQKKKVLQKQVQKLIQEIIYKTKTLNMISRMSGPVQVPVEVPKITPIPWPKKDDDDKPNMDQMKDYKKMKRYHRFQDPFARITGKKTGSFNVLKYQSQMYGSL